ncbi:MAG TPA: carboxypeptidase regulatory-like domain-containing protein, partial [Armatimonadota bacterium]|nr:carboxypeptidase regulatory-like domain-containing protein [Armatimonadota bacterium]
MRRVRIVTLPLIVLLVVALPPIAALAQDADGDGLPDEVERRLGTDPAVAEKPELIAEDETGDVPEGTPGSYDVTRIWMANAGHQRWVWAIEFAEPHVAENTIATLYLDADGDPSTGREAMGCEVAYSHLAGEPVQSLYVTGPRAAEFTTPRCAIEAGVLYFCAEAPIKQVDGRSRFRIRVHSQTYRQPEVKDRFGFVSVQGPPDSDTEPPKLTDLGLCVSGLVLDGEGAPVWGAMAYFNSGPGGVVRYANATGEDGRFKITQLPDRGEGYVLIVSAGFAPSVLPARPGTGENVPDLKFTLAPGHYATGKVTDRDGNPLADVRITPRAKALESAAGGRYIRPIEPQLSYGDGTFWLMDLPAADVTVDVSAQGYSYLRDHPIKIDADDNLIVLDPLGVITGKVVDEQTGMPVPAFKVRLAMPTEALAPDAPRATMSYSWTERGRDFASPDGLFTAEGLTTGAAHAVIVSAEGYAPTRVEPVVAAPADDAKWPVVIKLGRGETLTGTITGPDGAPVDGAELVVLWSQREGSFLIQMDMLDAPERYYGLERRDARTDANGRFEVQGLAGEQHYTVVVRHDDYAAAVLREVSVTEPLAVQLQRGGVIAGSVAGFGEFDLENSSIDVWTGDTQWCKAKIAPDGSFESVRLPPGEYQATIYALAGTRQRPHPRRGVTVAVREAETISLDFAALGGVTVRGRVLFRGQPLANADVHIYWSDNGHQSSSDRTGSAGEFVLYAVPPGKHMLWGLQEPQAAGGTWRGASEVLTVGDQDITQDLIVPGGALTGTVTDMASREGQAEVSVGALRLDANRDVPDRLRAYRREETGLVFAAGSANFGWPEGLTAQRGLGGTIAWTSPVSHTSGLGGGFTVGGLRAGRYLLTWQGAGDTPDPIPGLAGTVEVGQDETVEHDLTIERGGALRLQVLDAGTGEPVPGARVMLCTPDGAQLTDKRRRPLTEEERAQAEGRAAQGYGGRTWAEDPMQTDERGLVEVEGAPVCTYGAWVIADGYVAQWVPEVPSAREPATTTVRLARGGTLALRPGEGALEGITNPYAVWRITDADGRIVFPGGENHSRAVWDTGAAFLVGEHAGGYRLALAPGAYTVRWELHGGPNDEDRGALLCK